MNSRKLAQVPLEPYLVLNMNDEDVLLLLLENFFMPTDFSLGASPGVSLVAA